MQGRSGLHPEPNSDRVESQNENYKRGSDVHPYFSDASVDFECIGFQYNYGGKPQ